MSSRHDWLVEGVLRRLSRAPSTLLEDLTREFHVSKRTLENAISMTTGKTFRGVREVMLVKRVKSFLKSCPTQAIKVLCFQVGFKSPRSFARAIRRACGCSPGELRSRIIRHLLQDQKRTALRESQLKIKPVRRTKLRDTLR